MTDDQLTDLATLHLAGKEDGDTLDLLPLLRAVEAAERERCALAVYGLKMSPACDEWEHNFNAGIDATYRVLKRVA